MGTNGRRQENNGNMSRGTPKIVGSVPNWDFGKGGAHSSKSLPLRIPTGDLVKCTPRAGRDDRSAVLCADFKWTPLRLICGQHF